MWLPTWPVVDHYATLRSTAHWTGWPDSSRSVDGMLSGGWSVGVRIAKHMISQSPVIRVMSA
eukprot:15452228-Alexandrium_andersonii.AAC.1